MKATAAIVWIAVSLGVMCLPQARGDMPTQGYLALTKENIPHIQVVIQAALDASDVEEVSLSEMKKQARRSALLPRLRLRADYDPNAIDVYEYGANARQYADGSTWDRWDRVGNTEDRLSYGGFVEWDLSALLWEWEDHNMAYQYAAQGGLKRRRIVEVSRRYTSLKNLLPDDSSGSVKKSDLEAVLNHAVYLDTITNHLLSDTLVRLKVEAGSTDGR
jgi:hypothetical protein